MVALVLWDKLCFQGRIKHPKNTIPQKKKIIQTIDEEILALIAERQQLSDEVTELEKVKGQKLTPVKAKAAKERALAKITRQAKKLKINEKYVEKVFKSILR